MVRGFLILFGLLSAQPASAETGECLQAPYDGKAGPAALVQVVREIEQALAPFPEFLEAWKSIGPEICLSQHLFEERGYFDPANNRIVLDGSLPLGLMGAVLVHELRHVEQYQRGICPSTDLAMAEYARGTFALEADANVTSVVVAWQARVAGRPAFWQALQAWDMSADVAGRFEEVMERTSDVSFAAAAAFDQWYASDLRREVYYIASCSAFLDEQDRTHALSGYGEVPEDYFAQLCRLPDGRAYDCAEGALGRAE